MSACGLLTVRHTGVHRCREVIHDVVQELDSHSSLVLQVRELTTALAPATTQPQ